MVTFMWLLSVAAMSIGASPVRADSSPPLMVLGHDHGAVPAETVIGELLARFRPDLEDTVHLRDRKPVDLSRAIRQSGLPVVTNLVPDAGRAGVKELDVPLTHPVCVIGPDPVSLRWLSRNRKSLAQMGARCILVSARDPGQVGQVRKAARPIMVQVAPFDGLAAMYGIRTIPMLLVGKGIQ